MPGLHLHRSNRLDVLLEALAEVLKTPLGSPLQSEVIAVQSVGMRRWLSLRIAERLGVTMNFEFPFPATLAHQVFRGAFAELDDSAAFSSEILLWKTMALLPGVLDAADAASLADYMTGENRELKAYQLSGQVAGVFDRYLLHRTGKLLEWQEREDKGWQERLWRELITGHERTNPPALLHRFIERCRDNPQPLKWLPERLSVFGVSSLSPFYVQLLSAAASCVDVHLYLFEPTPHYIGDTQSHREQSRFMQKVGNPEATPEDYHLDAGNPLLVSMAKPSRAFSRILADLQARNYDEGFREPDEDTLLNSIRADIYHLRDRKTDGEPLALVSEEDRSVQVHCCHGPMREVEVLYDRLLELFEKMPGLTPKDILVMTPDVETYAPFIEAVFGCPEDEHLRIPFTIADRRMQMEAPLAQSFANLLDLHGSRYPISSVLALLEFEPLRARFGVSESDLGTIREWVESASIRWGIDSEHRKSFDLPVFEQNSWRQGLDRLLLGYALPGDERHLYQGILPVPSIEGSRANLLGQFVDLCEKLFSQLADLGSARTLTEWAETLRGLLVSFYEETDETTDDFERIRAVFDQLEHGGNFYSGSLPIQVVRAHLAGALADSDSGFGFLAGHTTFCSLKPMRSVPFRVICVLGLNDTGFPRHDMELPFDLSRTESLPGDRSRRDDDRQLFLETLLSAGDVLYLSYSGLSLRDQSESPPSVVISELLDYIESNYRLHDGPGEIRTNLVTKHRLQPFSQAYFRGDSRLFSYSRENCDALGNRSRRDGTRQRFIDRPLSAKEDALSHLSIEQLASFLCHPQRMFVRERLGIRLGDRIEALEDTEPMSLDALAKTQLCGKVIDWSQDGMSADEIRAVTRASGQLPLAWAGDTGLHDVACKAEDLLERMQPIMTQPVLPSLEIDLQIGEVRLSGYLRQIHEVAALRYRAAGVKSKDLLRAWIAHLAMLATRAAGYPDRTVIFGTTGHETLGPVECPEDILEDLIDLYRTGMRQPLSFFPESSKAYAEVAFPSDGDGDPDEAMEAALVKWEGGQFANAVPGEGEDDFVRLCFRGIDNPFDEAWIENTRRVYQPLLAALKSEDTK